MKNQKIKHTQLAKLGVFKFGTYGFMSMLLATQMAASPTLFADSASDKIDRAGVDAKKSGRSMRRDLKKAGRKATGQESTYDDVKDRASDAVDNVQDEAGYQKRKAERHDD